MTDEQGKMPNYCSITNQSIQDSRIEKLEAQAEELCGALERAEKTIALHLDPGDGTLEDLQEIRAAIQRFRGEK